MPGQSQPVRPPLTLLGAAAVVAAQALIVLAAAVLAAVAAATGQSYRISSGIAITVIGLLTAAGLGAVAVGLTRARRWSRTPAMLSDFFCGVVGVYLVQGGRLWWGAPLLALAVVGLVLMLVPPSLRVFSGQ